MRFQGEICTLSFGLHFNESQVQVNGTLWPRRLAVANPGQQQQPRLRFSSTLAENDVINLQHWLLTDIHTPFALPNAVRQVRRVVTSDTDTICLDVELNNDQVPTWWDWPVRFPLCVRLEIRPNEFAYLTGLLSRERWSADLTW